MNMSETVVWAAPDENFWELELVHFPWGYWRKVQESGRDDRPRDAAKSG